MSLIEVRNLFKNYGAIRVLRDVSFDLADGETLAVIGPNGAGKTTLFRSLTGESRVNSGKIVYDGRDVSAFPAHRRVRMGMGRTFQIARVFRQFTAFENIQIAVESRMSAERKPDGRWLRRRCSASARDEIVSWLDAVGLSGRQDIEAQYLSHGDNKRLEIAVALSLEPRVLMLDEPTAGMSPSDRAETVALIARVRTERKLTAMLTEHDMDVVFGLADRIMVLNYGQVVTIGAPSEVRDDPAVREVYLGQEEHDPS
jgi:branched-chain amino acid transport system ATP-binding protein